MMARQAVIMLLLLAQSGQNRKFLYLKISVKQSGAVEHSRSKINSEITSSLLCCKDTASLCLYGMVSYHDSKKYLLLRAFCAFPVY